MNCLDCGKTALEAEVYQGIVIRVCDEGHRTGISLEAPGEKQPLEGWFEQKSA